MIYLLFLLSTFSGVLSVALSKVYRKPIEDDRFADTLYYAISVPAALLYFAIMSGFSFKVNLVTLVYSVIFSFVCYGAVFFQLHALHETSLVNVSIFSSSGSVIVSSIAGILFFKESISVKSAIGLLFTLVSISVPYFASKKHGTSLKGLMFCLLLFFNSGLARIIMKLYQETPGCMSENIFCFYTNVFLMPFVVLMHKKSLFDKSTYRNILKYKKSALLVALATLTSNFSTLVSLIIVGKVDLLFSSVFGPPLSICTNFLFDTIVFKEKIKKESIISIVFAVVAMLLLV